MNRMKIVLITVLVLINVLCISHVRQFCSEPENSSTLLPLWIIWWWLISKWGAEHLTWSGASNVTDDTVWLSRSYHTWPVGYKCEWRCTVTFLAHVICMLQYIYDDVLSRSYYTWHVCCNIYDDVLSCSYHTWPVCYNKYEDDVLSRSYHTWPVAYNVSDNVLSHSYHTWHVCCKLTDDALSRSYHTWPVEYNVSDDVLSHSYHTWPVCCNVTDDAL